VRIVFLSHYAFPHVGGIETAIDGVAEELAARGHEVVHVASTAGNGSRLDHAAPYRVVRVPALNVLEGWLSVPYPLFDIRLPLTLRRELQAADVVHAHGFLYMPTLFGLPLARRSRSRPLRVLTEHVGHVPYESKALDGVETLAIRTLGRACLRAAEAIVVNNERVEAELRGLAPGRRIDYIANGIDTDRFRPPSDDERGALRRELGWRNGEPRVLFVGRPVPKKGIDLALATAQEGNGSFELVLVGPEEHEIAPHPAVSALGPQPRERLEELYRAADALLLPSQGEGFPMTVQEAMASGLPVVLIDDPGYGPQLEGAAEGVRLTAPSASSMVEALVPLVKNEDDWRAASRAAEAHAKRQFSCSRAADEHEALYERVRADRKT
jgi:D-inositol-3-phosphate glycosyltransferase